MKHFTSLMYIEDLLSTMTILDYSNHKKKGLDFLEEMRELRRRKGDTQEHSVCGCVPTEHSARHQWLLQLGTSEKPTR